MKYYIEIFSDDSDELIRYQETTVTPEMVIEVYEDHPVGMFDLEKWQAEKLNLQGLDFEKYEHYLVSAREYPEETYEYEGEVLYPPPLFLPDSFNSDPVKPK
jgi:hypothetical protein